MKAAATNVYTKTEIDDKFTISNTLISTSTSSVNLGADFRLRRLDNNNTFTIDKYYPSFSRGGDGWTSLFSMTYNPTTDKCNLIVNTIDMFNLIDNKLSKSTLLNSYVVISNSRNESIAVFNDNKNADFQGDLDIAGGYLKVNSINTSTGNVITIYNNVVIGGSVVVNGTITANNSNPFYCGGEINGGTLATLSNLGRKGFSVTRVATFAAGVYYIQFDTAYNNANYVVSLTNESTGHCKVWDYTRPTAAGFYVVTMNTSNILADSIFHFTVFV